ncbi:hypothetical protein [Flavobacterium sp. DSR3-2]|uniref:hypothetical protein n=1 Tax=unclassified Flavobacterium TaxID=196869 RepID=UPI003CEE9DD1
MRIKGLVVTDKTERVFNFNKNTLYSADVILPAASKKSFAGVDINIFVHGAELVHLSDLYFSK